MLSKNQKAPSSHIRKFKMKIISAAFLVIACVFSTKAQDVEVLKDNMKPYYSEDGKSMNNYGYGVS